ncbi:uncharacterized protein [Haliotis cracherodii]|uniref:uncharacterized protein n=1 Tax=Haliotis cracherodii TaxID=6455 RepID=UPI0039E7CCBF
MAYSSAVNAGPVPEQFVDKEVESRTVRVYSTARFTSVPDFARLLTSAVPDFSLPDCVAIWRTERSGQVYVTLKSVSVARKLLDLNCVSHGVEKLYFYAYGVFMVPLRIHWLHATVTSDFLKDFFSRYGRVLDAFREFLDVDGVNIFTGVRIVRMELTDSERACIPHIVRFGDKQSMLVTAPGRLPICLKCHSVGHVRARCPGSDLPTPSTRPPTVAPDVSDVVDAVTVVPVATVDASRASVVSVPESVPGADTSAVRPLDLVSLPAASVVVDGDKDACAMDSVSADSDVDDVIESECVVPSKRKQSPDDLPGVGEVEKKKKVASVPVSRSSPISWADQDSQSDVLLAQIPDAYVCPARSGSSQRRSGTVGASGRSSLSSTDFRKDVPPPVVKEDSESDEERLWFFKLRVSPVSSGSGLKVDVNKEHCNECVLDFPTDVREKLRVVVRDVLEKKVNFFRHYFPFRPNMTYGDFVISLCEEEIRSGVPMKPVDLVDCT